MFVLVEKSVLSSLSMQYILDFRPLIDLDIQYQDYHVVFCFKIQCGYEWWSMQCITVKWNLCSENTNLSCKAFGKLTENDACTTFIESDICIIYSEMWHVCLCNLDLNCWATIGLNVSQLFIMDIDHVTYCVLWGVIEEFIQGFDTMSPTYSPILIHILSWSYTK